MAPMRGAHSLQRTRNRGGRRRPGKEGLEIKQPAEKLETEGLGEKDLCLEGVPDLPVAPQDEAGLTKTFQTWPRGGFHIP